MIIDIVYILYTVYTLIVSDLLDSNIEQGVLHVIGLLADYWTCLQGLKSTCLIGNFLWLYNIVIRKYLCLHAMLFYIKFASWFIHVYLFTFYLYSYIIVIHCAPWYWYWCTVTVTVLTINYPLSTNMHALWNIDRIYYNGYIQH
jgi:hypothetical protein